MTISSKRRQRRIDLIEKENQAIKKLNDLSQIKSRVETEDSLVTQDEIETAVARLKRMREEFHG